MLVMPQQPDALQKLSLGNTNSTQQNVFLQRHLYIFHLLFFKFKEILKKENYKNNKHTS